MPQWRTRPVGPLPLSTLEGLAKLLSWARLFLILAVPVVDLMLDYADCIERAGRSGLLVEVIECWNQISFASYHYCLVRYYDSLCL